MNRKEIVAAWNAKTDGSRLWYELGEDEKLAWAMTLEREACAKVCEEKKLKYEERASRPEKVRDINPEVARIAGMTCDHCAADIRARSNT